MNIKKRGSVIIHMMPLLLVFIAITFSCCCCCSGAQNSNSSDIETFLERYCSSIQNTPFGPVCVPYNP